MRAQGRRLAATAVAVAVAVLLPVLPQTRAADPGLRTVAAPKRPNVVLVVLDDFSMDLLQTLRSARTMRARGASYPHAFVVDSLCCVSRASTFTGQYPHQTGVRTNVADPTDPADPRGGYTAFARFGNRERTVAVRLQAAGYTTGYVGKYLNQYEYSPGDGLPPTPPGWSDWRVVFGSAYDGWEFYSTRTLDGKPVLRYHPAPPASAPPATKDASYAGTVIGADALEFIAAHEGEAEPYFLQVAPYAPHGRVHAAPHYAGDPVFPPAFRDRPGPGQPGGNCGAVPCASLTVRDLPGFSDPQGNNRPRRLDGSPAPRWNGRAGGLPAPTAVHLLRSRAQMAQSADRMLTRILEAVGPDTYVILTSDNGFHLGQQGLAAGKGTPYTTDVRVPLLVVGPGVTPGPRREMVSNLDLAPTLERLAGLQPAAYRSGESLVASLTDRRTSGRDYVFFEHSWSRVRSGDPDRVDELRTIPSYVAVRSRTRMLVRFDLDPSARTSYAWELYDLTRDRFEKTNVFARRKYAGDVRELRHKLGVLDACSGIVGNEPVRGGCRTIAAAARP